MAKSLEEYTLEQEKKENEWHDKYDLYSKDLLLEIDRCLKVKSEDSISRLYSIFNDDSIINIMKNNGDFVLVYCIMMIFAREREAGRENNILNMVESIQDAKDISRFTKYKLWRCEFWKDKTELEELVHIFISNNFSPEFIVEMVGYVSYDKTKVLQDILEMLICAKKYVLSIRIIEFAQSKNINSAEIENYMQEIQNIAKRN